MTITARIKMKKNANPSLSNEGALYDIIANENGYGSLLVSLYEEFGMNPDLNRVLGDFKHIDADMTERIIMLAADMQKNKGKLAFIVEMCQLRNAGNNGNDKELIISVIDKIIKCDEEQLGLLRKENPKAAEILQSIINGFPSELEHQTLATAANIYISFPMFRDKMFCYAIAAKSPETSKYIMDMYQMTEIDAKAVQGTALQESGIDVNTALKIANMACLKDGYPDYEDIKRELPFIAHHPRSMVNPAYIPFSHPQPFYTRDEQINVFPLTYIFLPKEESEKLAELLPESEKQALLEDQMNNDKPYFVIPVRLEYSKLQDKRIVTCQTYDNPMLAFMAESKTGEKGEHKVKARISPMLQKAVESKQ